MKRLYRWSIIYWAPSSNTFSETASHRFPALLRTAKKKTQRASLRTVSELWCVTFVLFSILMGRCPIYGLTTRWSGSICTLPILPVAATSCSTHAAARLRILKPCIGCEALADNLRKVEFNLLDCWLYVCSFHNLWKTLSPDPFPVVQGKGVVCYRGTKSYLMLDIFMGTSKNCHSERLRKPNAEKFTFMLRRENVS